MAGLFWTKFCESGGAGEGSSACCNLRTGSSHPTQKGRGPQHQQQQQQQPATHYLAVEMPSKSLWACAKNKIFFLSLFQTISPRICRIMYNTLNR